jgi:hypothetical protein
MRTTAGRHLVWVRDVLAQRGEASHSRQQQPPFRALEAVGDEKGVSPVLAFGRDHFLQER